ncbi:MAG: crotonase/enoyl-CoA hydratase family protein [Actinomycetia bacterium]|nr:crotonase/enoyl-CoA hydratase family protein [Actinomycetes bacterium]
MIGLSVPPPDPGCFTCSIAAPNANPARRAVRDPSTHKPQPSPPQEHPATTGDSAPTDSVISPNEQLSDGFDHWNDRITTDGQWDPGKDFAWATSRLTAPTQKFMSIWHTHKPVIVQIHGWCVGGASDTALCGDLVIASEDARIGTPYSRMWGSYLSGMWLYRLGLTKAKEYALTGKPLSGREAADIGLINDAVPFERLEETVRERAEQLASIPASQLAAMKLVVNHAFENMGISSTQVLGPILDGLMRNTPDALGFIDKAATEGVRAVIEDRDRTFGDHSQGPDDQQPDPSHIIVP